MVEMADNLQWHGPRPPRDWLGHGIQIVIVIVMVVPLLLYGQHFVDENKMDMQRYVDAYKTTNDAVNQRHEEQMISLRRDLERAEGARTAAEQRTNARLDNVDRKLDDAAKILSSLETNIRLLRELKK